MEDSCIIENKADLELAREKLKNEIILRSDGTPHNFIRSGITSISDKQDVLLFDYLYFLKKIWFIMGVLAFIYIANFTANTWGDYLEYEDIITGFEKLTLANISGLKPMVRFDLEKGIFNSSFLNLIW